MKKKAASSLITALVVALVISVAMFMIEGISAYTKGQMPISHTDWGGEYAEDVGIGWSIGTTYPMTSTDSPNQAQSTSKIFINGTIVPFFLIVWAVIFAIIFIARGKKKALIILAVLLAGIVVCVSIFIGVKKVVNVWDDTPKEIFKIDITTGAFNVDNITHLEYRQKGEKVKKTTVSVKILNPAENGDYAYFDTKNLNIDSDYVASKDQAKKLEKCMRKLKKEDDELGYLWRDKEFAYYIKVSFVDNNGKYDNHTLHANQEFTKSWPEFAGIINEIVGEDCLLENPEFIDKSQENIEKIFGVSEADMPEGGSVDVFFRVRRLNEINIWGAEYNGKMQSIGEELEAYRKMFESK